ncbi:type II toxin-antitoxin system VapC family toxin [Arthrobacter sp. UYEF20]|uniref:type II toxin-antitoxin system VapC family toxin n=1 Tax=Arthrobacter sp. UYEF20 TaxID=1756363 RepID=UPI003391305E
MDTSAVLKLVVEGRESSAAATYPSTAAAHGDKLVASMLLYTELHCAAHRRGFPGGLVNSVLGSINLLDLARSDLMYAAALPGGLRSADAIHLAVAIRLQADVLVAYDAGLLAAAVDAGLNVLSLAAAFPPPVAGTDCAVTRRNLCLTPDRFREAVEAGTERATPRQPG